MNKSSCYLVAAKCYICYANARGLLVTNTAAVRRLRFCLVESEPSQLTWQKLSGGREKKMSALNKIAVASLLLGRCVPVAVADEPPKLDVTTTCNATARYAVSVGRDKEACQSDEHTAETTLAQNWSNTVRTTRVRDREDWRAVKLRGTVVVH
jgi:hypothetical protein